MFTYSTSMNNQNGALILITLNICRVWKYKWFVRSSNLHNMRSENTIIRSIY